MAPDDGGAPLCAFAAVDAAGECCGNVPCIGRRWRGAAAALTLALGSFIAPAVHAQQHRPVESAATQVRPGATAAIGGPAPRAGHPQGGVRFPVLPAGALVRPPAPDLQHPGLRAAGPAAGSSVAAESAATGSGTAGLAAARAGPPAHAAGPGWPVARGNNAPAAHLASNTLPPSRNNAGPRPRNNKPGNRASSDSKFGDKSGNKENSGNKSGAASADNTVNAAGNGRTGAGPATAALAAARPANTGNRPVKDRSAGR